MATPGCGHWDYWDSGGQPPTEVRFSTGLDTSLATLPPSDGPGWGKVWVEGARDLAACGQLIIQFTSIGFNLGILYDGDSAFTLKPSHCNMTSGILALHLFILPLSLFSRISTGQWEQQRLQQQQGWQ